MASSDHRAVEIIAVIITATGKFLFYDIWDQRLLFIILIFGFWSVYLVRRVRQSPSVLTKWGFRTDNFMAVLNKILPFGLLALMACLIVGTLQGTLNPHWHIIPLLFLYPIFGVLQQFLLMALVAGNLQDLNRYKHRTIIVLSAILFGLLHFPYWWLMIGTFILALFYTYVYLKNRNLYILGIFHGWLGAIFYYTVVDKDPFLEVFGFLLK